MGRLIGFILAIAFIAPFFALSAHAALENATIYSDNSYNVQDIIVSNPQNAYGPFDNKVSVMISDLSNNVFQGWESYAYTFSNLSLSNIAIVSLNFEIRMNSSIIWADDYLKLSYSTNGGLSRIGLANLQPGLSLKNYGNYSVPISSTSQLNNFQVKLQYIMIGSTDAEIGDNIAVDGIQGYVVYNTSDPHVYNTTVNHNGVSPNYSICINQTIVPGTYSINSTWVTASYPNGTVANITTTNQTSVCGGGNSTYTALVDVGPDYGNLYINNSWAQDSQGTVSQQEPAPGIPVLVRDDVLIVTLTGTPVCFGTVYPNDAFVHASAGNVTGCSSDPEGFPMNISIESNVPTSLWFSASDLNVSDNSSLSLGVSNLYFSYNSTGNKTSMSSSFKPFESNIPEGNSTYSAYWWLYLDRSLYEGNYTTTINIKVNRTY